METIAYAVIKEAKTLVLGTLHYFTLELPRQQHLEEPLSGGKDRKMSDRLNDICHRQRREDCYQILGHH